VVLALAWAFLQQPVLLLEQAGLVRVQPQAWALLQQLLELAVQQRGSLQPASLPVVQALSLAEQVVNKQALRSNQFYPPLSALANRSERFVVLVFALLKRV